MPNWVGGVGPFEPKLMIIGEAPGKNEDETGIPFAGPTGRELDKMLALVGVSRLEVYITNVIKMRPPFNDLKKLYLIDVDINSSIEWLWENEIRRIKPNAILAIGDLALQATTGYTGVLNYRGSILRGREGYKVIPTIHPAALFSRFTAKENSDSDGSEQQTGGLDYTYARLIQHDIRRAVIESETNTISLPDRNLHVARNSLDLYRFLQQYSGSEFQKAAVDIESINCIPVCIGFAFSPHHAISIPLINQIGKVVLSEMRMNEISECWTLIDETLRRIKIIGQNYKYDEFKLNLFGFRSPNVYSDTLIKTRVLFPELPKKSLDVQSSIWTREPYYKEEGKEFKLGKSPIDQLFLYNAKDCAVTYEIDEAQEVDLIEMGERYNVPLKEYYYDYMMKKHKFYLKMENVGFAVDHERKKELSKKYFDMQQVQHMKNVELIGWDLNVKSPPQKIRLLRELKLPVYKKSPTSEDSFVKMLGSHCKGKDGPKKQQIIEGILEESRIRDQRSRYVNFAPDYDGRCRSAFNISATETCRSSTGILQKPLRPRKMGLAFHTISKHGRLAKDIRSMFIPDKGKVFIQADGSQFQARVVAVLSKDWELLTAFDTIDLHRRTAGLAFGLTSYLNLSIGHLPIVDDLDKDGPERFTGKKIRHAGNFDMKKRRFMTEFNTDAQKFGINMTISEWKAGQMLDLFHAASPKLRGIFHEETKEVLMSTRTLIDPFGGVRVFNGRMDEDLFKEGYANIPQRTEAHQIQRAALAVSETIDWQETVFLSENHDSLLMQAPEHDWERHARELKKELERPIDFHSYCSLKRDIDLVIPVDIELSDTNYAELRKVKLP